MVIIDRTDKWGNGKTRTRKPLTVKRGRSWSCNHGRSLTVYDKESNEILSLAEGEWVQVRRG